MPRCRPLAEERGDPTERVCVLIRQLVGREPAQLRDIVGRCCLAGEDASIPDEVENRRRSGLSAVPVDERTEEETGLDLQSSLLVKLAAKSLHGILGLLEEASGRVPEPRVRLARPASKQHAALVVGHDRRDSRDRVGVVGRLAGGTREALLASVQCRPAARAVPPAVQETHAGTVPPVSPRHSPASVTELSRIGLFAELPGETLTKLADRMQREEVSSGARILSEGDPGDRFYVLLSGLAAVSQDALGSRNVLRPGEFFGEVAVAMDVPRTATVTAMTPCVVASCDRTAFDELLRPLFADDGSS
jgi:hypothetical protein